MGSCLCEHCAAACCRYLAIEIDEPTTVRDYDDIRWYLLHDGIWVFVEEESWYIQIRTVCVDLRADNLCGIYETRPRICREYEAKDCDYSVTGAGYDHMFTHASQIEAYYEKRTGKKLPLQPTPPRRAVKRAAKKRTTCV